MAKNVINRGSTPNDGTGDNLRTGALKVNQNFDEIYTAIGDGTNINGTIKIADDSSTVVTLSANGETLKVLGGTGITSTVSGNNLTLAVDNTIITGSSSTTLTNKTINGPDNTITNLSATSITSGAFNLTSEENKIRFNYDGTGNFPTAATYEGMFVFDKAAGQKKPYVASASGYINILTENDSVGRHADVNISGVSNGDGLIFNSAQGRFNVGALPSTGFSIAMAVAL